MRDAGHSSADQLTSALLLPRNAGDFKVFGSLVGKDYPRNSGGWGVARGLGDESLQLHGLPRRFMNRIFRSSIGPSDG